MPRRAAEAKAASMAAGAGEQQGRGAGDDQHGDGRDHGPVPRLRVLAHDKPCDGGDCEHDGHKEPGDLLDEKLTGCAALLGLADQVHDLADGCVGADLGDLDVQAAGQVGCAGVDGIAHSDLGGNGFTCKGGLVDVGTTHDDLAVHRHVLARADADQVADLDLAEVDFLLGTVADHAGHVGGQVDELLDGPLCARGATTDELSEDDEDEGQPTGCDEEPDGDGGDDG